MCVCRKLFFSLSHLDKEITLSLLQHSLSLSTPLLPLPHHTHQNILWLWKGGGQLSHTRCHDCILRRPYIYILDLFGQSSPQEDGLFGSEGTPFRQKGGLFSGGGNLFDDVGGEKVCVEIEGVEEAMLSVAQLFFKPEEVIGS